jgi:DNA-binding transcriptional regulator YiaG
MKPELKARLGRLAPIQTIVPVPSGSSETIVVRPAGERIGVNTITATEALATRGLTLAQGKRIIETMMQRGEAVAEIPTVEDAAKLARDLRKCGIEARRIAHSAVDVKSIREALGLSQSEFAARFGLEVATVRNWEQARTGMDRPTMALLRAIAAAPRVVAEALEEKLG